MAAAEQLAEMRAEKQVMQSSDKARALMEDLMVRICDPSNLNRAYKRVKANKGAPGVDRLTVQEMLDYLRANGQELREQLLNGKYEPKPIRGVKIPKPDGSKRQLGIPTVIDRLVQQAVLQQLEPIYEAEFSDSSYGFRPNRSAHDALRKARQYVADGYDWVVDIDLEKFFDHVNHDILMGKIVKKIKDKRVLRLIRKYLQAGLMQDGMTIKREAGTPQGGPLSPLLSNIMLDELDKELERRGHKFCRYADDCNIYVRSEKAGNRVLKSVEQFLTKRLRLKLNAKKSACARVNQRKFLGYRLRTGGYLQIAPESVKRMKDKVRILTKRNRGYSLKSIIQTLNRYLVGWQNYFKLGRNKELMRGLDEWIRRRLRCYRLKQRKRCYPIVTWLMSLGVKENHAWNIGKSSKGWWRLSRNPVINSAMTKKWLKEQGLYSLLAGYERLNV